MASFNMSYNDSELIDTIKTLTPRQIEALRQSKTQADITMFTRQLLEEVVEMLVVRVKSAVITTFNGYGGRSIGPRGPRQPLAQSIYGTISDDGQIYISSPDEVMTILNAGFDSFDMKEKLRGRVMPLRLPGGRVIYRVVGDQSSTSSRVSNLNPDLKTKKNSKRVYYSTKNWIHPGYRGKHIYEKVVEEMQPIIKDHVRERVHGFLETMEFNPYTRSNSTTYYDNRNSRGQFSPYSDSDATNIGSAFEEDNDY